MNKWYAFCLALSVNWISLPAYADHLDCSIPNTQAERNQCALQNYESAYRGLRSLWSEAMLVAGRLDENMAAETKNKVEAATVVLYDSQNRWLRYSERACEAESLLWRGQEVESKIYYDCMLRLTHSRMHSLAAFVGEGAEATGAMVHVHQDGATHLHYK
jgi:uncharacterized protein YecT (DUF1311 family)